MTNSAEEYVTLKGWPIRKHEKWASGPQLVLDCPICGKQSDGEHRRFYIAEQTGLWKSWCCDLEGNLLTLQRRMGDLDVRIIGAGGGIDQRARALGQRILATRGGGSKRAALAVVDEKTRAALPPKGRDEEYHQALLAEPRAMEYLRAVRGFDDAHVELGKLGYRKGNDGREWITIPQYLSDGTLSGFKFRVTPWHEDGKRTRFAREAGCPTVLYGAQRLGHATSVTIYEGELDALSGDQLGCPAGVASTAGAKTWLPEWTALLAGVDTIFLAQDADQDGDEGASKVADALGRWRCRRVKLPLHDMNACLAAGVQAEVQAAFVAAEAMPHQMIGSAGGYHDGLMALSMSQARGASWGMATLDLLFAGRRGGEITVVSGETGQGKTTLTTFLCWLAATLGEPALIGSFEHQPLDEALKLVTMETGAEFVSLADADKERVIATLARKPLYLIDAYGSVDDAVVFDTLRYFYRACGGRLAVIDHLGFVIDNDRGGKPAHEATEKFLLALQRLLKTELPGLHVMVVVHPKNQQDEKGKPAKVTKFSLRGGANVRQTADNVLIVEKAVRLDGKHMAYIVLDKVRSIMAEEGRLCWQFDRPSLRYIEPALPTPTAVTMATAQALAAASTTLATAVSATPSTKVTAQSLAALDNQRLAAGEKLSDFYVADLGTDLGEKEEAS